MFVANRSVHICSFHAILSLDHFAIVPGKKDQLLLCLQHFVFEQFILAFKSRFIKIMTSISVRIPNLSDPTPESATET